MKQFELYLDESGNFEHDNLIDADRPNETSLVGGLLIETGKLSNKAVMEMIPEHVHCCEHYRKGYIGVLENLVQRDGRLVVFENKERIRVINGDITYLNIISEGLVKLFRDLSNKYSEGVIVKVVIATRKQMSAASGIIKQADYRTRLEEKVMMALGRQHVRGCQYELTFEDARTYKLLDFADIICNTWLTRRRSKKFNPIDQKRIEQIYSGQPIYPVFEDAMTAYLKQLLLERHYGEMIYQISTLPKLIGFTGLRNQLLQAILLADAYEQETWFAQMSLQLRQYNRLSLFADGIRVAENYQKYILQPLSEKIGSQRTLAFWKFDTDFYLLTMYDHIGNANKCQEYLQLCRSNIDCVNRSWEHIDYYFRFCIRELNVLMGRYAFEEVLERSEKLIKIFTEAREMFSLIKTYGGKEQELRSELLGKAYGVRLEAIINLLNRKPELLDEALLMSDLALKEFDGERDISRQYQWRCLLMVEARRSNDAVDALWKALSVDQDPKPINAFIEKAYLLNAGYRDFLLWHYTNTMLLLKEEKNPQADDMAIALLKDRRFLDELKNPEKKGHPWNLVVWNIAKYSRSLGKVAEYKGFYKKALRMTRENKSHVTMLTFALSMSADRLLWCQRNSVKDTEQAQTEFEAVFKQINGAGLTKEMKEIFRANKCFAFEEENLSGIINAYLK